MWVALLLLLSSTAAYADGAVATGFTQRGTAVGTMAISRSSMENARKRALEDCRKTGQGCSIVHEFRDQCAAIVIYADRITMIGSGKEVEEARRNALAQCSARGNQCAPVQSGCDVPRVLLTGDILTAIWQWGFLIVLAGTGVWYFRRFLPVREKPAPVQQTIDTPSAERHLHASWDYVKKTLELMKKKQTPEKIEEIYQNLNHASHHLVKARTFDATAKIEINYNDQQWLTQPGITGLLLYIIATYELKAAHDMPYRFFARRHLKQAASQLEQAIQYEAQPIYYARLAEIHAHLGNQAEAQRLIKIAAELEPDREEITQLEQSIPGIPEMLERSRTFEISMLFLTLLSTATVFALIAFITGIFERETRIGLYANVITVWVLVLAYLAIRNQTRKQLAGMWWTYTHYKTKQKEESFKSFIHDLHGKRWRGFSWRDI